MPAHLRHAARERGDGTQDLVALEIAQHVVAVAHRLDGAQGAVQERRQPVALAAGRERGHDLIEPQVTEERGLLAGPVVRRVRALSKRMLT